MRASEVHARRQAAQALANAGVSTPEIARLLKVSPATARRDLEEMGCGRPTGRPRKSKVDPSGDEG
jgi:DeoR/GlpR family transcriptional regulator of sugar metabolism